MPTSPRINDLTGKQASFAAWLKLEEGAVCSHYEAPTPVQLKHCFGVELEGSTQTELWPGHLGAFLLRPDGTADGSPSMEVMPGVFGLLPFWAKDRKFSRHTYNARTETVADKPSFRDAWRHARHCIIPAVAIYEPDWRSGKAVPTRISRVDGELMGIAGLWDRWKSPEGEVVYSYTMLTVNADDHPLMKNYHRPEDEKRMVVILPKGLYAEWLSATAANSREFLKRFPADRLIAV